MKALLTFILVCFSLAVYSQNLVPNPSFELLYRCPSKHTQHYNEFDTMIYDWKIPSWGTPDIHSICTNHPRLSVPLSYQEYNSTSYCYSYQQPRTGSNYLELANYSGLHKTGDLVQTRLINPLRKNLVYRIAFYISINDCSGYYSDGAGAYLSKNKPEDFRPNFNPNDSCYRTICPKIYPQVRWKGGIIRDTSNWTLIEGFYKAEGGEEWITISTFHDNNTQIDSFNSRTLWLYLDDVSVEYEYYISADKDSICECDSVQLSATDDEPHFFSFSSDGANPMYGNPKLYLCNSKVIYYFRNQVLIDSIPIVSKKQSDNVSIPSILCPDSMVSLNLPHFDSTQYYLNNNKIETNPLIVWVSDRYSLRSASPYFCSIDTNFTLVTPAFSEGFDTVFCIDDKPGITLSTQHAFTQYTWFPDQIHAEELWVNNPNQYTLLAKDSLHCLHTFLFQVKTLCTPKLWIPNAFTPGSSPGKNDLFEVKAEYVSNYSLRIYNRWGQLVFSSNQPTKQWDGTFQSLACPAGVYFYQFDGTGIEPGHSLNQSGTIQLLR
ncbi:MAG: gliding motility-associated C-terminal domain-containing protein [Bacteroidetes bacterium]|nr:MAG: gliding motility-associated C-terminal domain-containing protein [Bacteroidota bacterium]